MLPAVTLVLGGVASGRTRFAEALVTGTGRARVRIVTAGAPDTGARGSGDARATMGDAAGWHTLREPLDLGRRLAAISGDSAVLVDCATLWLSNHLADGSDPAEVEAALFAGLALCAAPVVILSDEAACPAVSGSVPEPRFLEVLGGLNRKLAARAGLAVMVVAGLPLVLKGSLP